MRVLIAEDDAVTARMLQGLIRSWGYEVVTATDGPSALAMLQSDDAPQLALLDWMMPGVDGPDICRTVRQRIRGDSTYLLLLTARHELSDIVTGLDAGADDYLVKPFEPEELRARVKAGARISDLQQRLAAQVTQLGQALSKVRRLSGLLPICAYGKAIRDDSDYWHRVEEYVTEHAEVTFSHGICPNCLDAALKEARAAS